MFVNLRIRNLKSMGKAFFSSRNLPKISTVDFTVQFLSEQQFS